MADTPVSLRALLANLIDYAGLYPPASLVLREVAARYQDYLESEDGWILNRLVLPSQRLAEIPLGEDWRVTLLVESEPGPLPPEVETLETKLAHGFSLPTYCEVPVDRVTGAFVKVRTGGLTAEAIPTPEALADFLHLAAARRLPFKATAGLHHPIRGMRPLTYEPDPPRATLHGFLNVFTAAAFAWHGLERTLLVDVLTDEDPRAFRFGAKGLDWRGRFLSTLQIQMARYEFAHSFGSCSFEEPVDELRELGLLE